MKKLLSGLRKLTNPSALPPLDLGIIIAVFAFFTLGQLQRIEVLPGVAIYMHELLMMSWCLLQIQPLKMRASATITFFSKWLRNPRYWLILAFVLWTLLGMLVAFTRESDLVPFLYLSRLVFYGLFFWTVAVKVSEKRLSLQVVLLATAVWYWWLALLQYLFLPDTRFLMALGWDEHYYRMIGTLFDPGFTGMLFILGLLTAWSLQQVLPRWLVVALSLAFVSGVLLTYSRASYLTLAVVVVAYTIKFFINSAQTSRLVQFSVLTALTALLVFTLAPKPGGEGVNLWRTSTINARIATIKTAFLSLENYHWLLGRGLFTAPANALSSEESTRVSHARMPDNILVTILTQTGLIGMILVAVLLRKLLPTLWQKQPIIAIALLGLLTHSQFNNTLLQPFVLFYFLGMVVAYRR